MFTLADPIYTIRSPKNKEEWNIVKKLLLDYKHEFNDDTCFTSFEEELANIEQYYAGDDMLKLIAIDENNGTIAGCVAFKTFATSACEMKRLYVNPLHRGHQLGRRLVEALIIHANKRGYHKMILDTMVEMKAAQHLYHQLGFSIIAPYNHQDTAKLICFELNLNPG